MNLSHQTTFLNNANNQNESPSALAQVLTDHVADLNQEDLLAFSMALITDYCALKAVSSLNSQASALRA